MSLINITDLTFAYDGSYDNIFEDVSFQIDTDWKLGFIGRNGRGKTTLLNLLLGKYEYKGKISASVSFEYFPYFVKDKTIITKDVINNINSAFMDWELIRELSLLSVDEDVLYRPFETLSYGEQTKVMLATLFLKESSFLLIDEPTNHLDIDGRRIVSNYLNNKKGFILVSHDRAFLDGCIDHVLSINRSNIEVQRGNFSTWLVNKERQDNFELNENEKLKKDIKRLSKAAKQTSNWSEKVEKTKFNTKNSGIKPDKGFIGHKAEKMMQRSKSIDARRQKALEDKTRLLKNYEDTESLKISQLVYHANRIVTLDKVSINYDEKVVCSDVSLSIDKGDRIAISGKNGSGKSSILKLICGEEISHTGSLKIASNIIISYVSQDTSSLSGNLANYALESNIDESLFKAILRKLDFSRSQLDKNMEHYSGGQKKKILIAKSLCEKAHLYVWDEPLNFIDVISRMQIEQLLLEFEPTIIFVEHDSTFCSKIATKTIKL